MRPKFIISILVLTQIIVLGMSFGMLYGIEIQEKNMANYVNISGKNRLYTVMTLHKIDQFQNGAASKLDLENIMNQYQNNLLLLKNGGYFLNNQISPLPETYGNDLKIIEDKFQKLQSYINDLKESDDNSISLNSPYGEVEFELLDASDTLTRKITFDYSDTVVEKSNLELILLGINTIVYIVTIFLIFKILKNESMQLRALEKTSIIGHLTSRLAHDLKNPLSVIKLNIEMLEEKPTTNNEFSQPHYDKIKKSLQKIFYIIDDVLEFARTKDLNLSKTSLLKILKESISNISIPDTVTLELPQNDVEVVCDPKKLESVFVNLIVNSVYEIQNTGKISLKIDDSPNSVKIHVIDSGAGIPNDILPKIFEPLYTSKPTGTGLGLGICKNIVEQHHGKITVKNNPTTFTIELPKTKS